MLKNRDIAKKFLFSFGVIIFIIIMVSLYSLYTINTNVKDLKERIAKINNAQELRNEILTNIQLNITKMPLTPNVEKRKEFYNEILRAREAYQKHIEFLKAKTRSEEGKKELNEAINAILNLKDSNNKVIQLVLAGKTEEAVSIHEQEMLLKLKIMQKELNDFVNFYAKRADELADQSSGYIKREFVILIVSGIIFAIVSFLVSVGVSRSVRISVEGLEKYFQGFTKEILQLILILPLEMK